MINTEQRDGVTVVTLAYGAASVMDLELCRGLTECFTQLQASDDRGAIVLTGTGSIFSAGVDLKRFLSGEREYVTAFYPALNDCFRAVWLLDRPLVAAINGHAIAGGCMLAACSDVRIMGKGKARIGVPELVVGVPFPPLVFEILRSAVPASHLREIAFLGETHGAVRALELGLIDRCELPDHVMPLAIKTAQALSRVLPGSFALNKRQARQPALDWLAANPEAESACFEQWRSDAVRDAVAAYVATTLG